MHKIDTACGPMYTLNPWLDRAICSEVIDRDCYGLRTIAYHFTPESLFDVGMGVGQVSMLARSFWPGIVITGFEADNDRAAAARLNVPGASVHLGIVGYQDTAAGILKDYGRADLLCIDCEGGEVPFFYDLHRENRLSMFPLIVGEWHHWPGRRLLEDVFRRDEYQMRFTDPEPGAGPWHYFAAIKRGHNPALADALQLT